MAETTTKNLRQGPLDKSRSKSGQTPKKPESEPTDGEHHLYEFAYVLSGVLEEEKSKEISSSFRSLIEQKHGMIIEESPPKLRKLAYPIKKQHEGFFGWVKFLINVHDIADIEKQAQKTTDIIRFLIVKSHREELIQRRTKTRKKVMTEEEKGKIEEIDKRLEEILGT